MTPIRRLFYLLVCAVALAVTATLASCGGGSDGGSAASGGQTGSVAVLFTDGPTTDFDEINITITRVELIGDNGARAEVFAGERTVNLLDLRNNSDIFSLVNINAGIYNKIRLIVTGLELVKKNEQGDIVVVQPRLPANGKIDLNPRADIILSAGESMILELDMDAERSFQAVELGNGEFNFRPVVFVKVVGGAETGKFVKLSGTIELEGTDPETYRLCKTDVDFDSDDDGDGDLDDGDDGDSGDDFDDDSNDDGTNDDFSRKCLTLQFTDDTSVFNADGAAAVADIMDGDLANVVGRLEHSGEGVKLNVLVVELGLSGTFADVEGTVATAYDDSTGVLEVDVSEGGGFDPGARIAVSLLDGAKVLSRSGLVLTPEEIEPGMEVKIEGLLTGDSPELQASVLFIDTQVASEQKLTGTVDLVSDTNGDFMLLGTASGDVCVRMESEGEIFEVSTAGDSLISEIIDVGDLGEGQVVDVYGHFDYFTGCFEAEAVIAASASI